MYTHIYIRISLSIHIYVYISLYIYIHIYVYTLLGQADEKGPPALRVRLGVRDHEVTAET